MGTVATGHSVLHIDITLLSQNQAGNYSTVRIQMYSIADSGWGGTSATAIGYSTSIPNGGGQVSSRSWSNPDRVDWADYTTNVTHLSNGVYSDSVHGHINATGTSTYGGPADVSQAFNPPRIPKAPGAPGLSAAAPVGHDITLTVTAPADNGGASISNYVTQYNKDGAGWTGNVNGGVGARTITGLAPGSYIFRAWATNSVGNSGYSASTAARQVLQSGKRATAAGSGSWASINICKRWNGTAWVDAVVKRATVIGTSGWVYAGS